MPSLAAVREARILALEAELSTLRGDSRPAFRYDHSTPLKDPYAHTGVRPWGGWRSGWKSPTRPRVRFGISWSVRENIEPAAVERSGRCEPSGRHASRGVGETMSEPTHEAPALIERDVLTAMTKQHPIEAAIWQAWIRDGRARIVGA
jgi:hypothetical protein